MNNCMTCRDDLGAFLQAFSAYYTSVKLDGVRCISTVHRGLQDDIFYKSRSGKEFVNFSKFDGALSQMAKGLCAEFSLPSIRFDGEVTAKDGNFSSVMQEVRRLHEVDPNVFEYHIFDIVLPMLPLTARLKYLEKHFVETDDVKLVEHVACLDPLKSMHLALAKGYEGIVLKAFNSPYEFKRSKYWCKVKESKTLDLQVVGKIEGTGKYVSMLGALQCDYNGKIVKVGTGFSDEQRITYWKDTPKLIEVGYQHETSKGSLRHPRFIRVRGDKDEHD